MSDAAPLPRLGEVFFDVRGNSRSMRLSWYSDTGVAVFSIWQAGMCTGTFRLPIGDLRRMIEILERGPTPQGRGRAPVSGGRREPERGRGEPERGRGEPERGRGEYPAAEDEFALLDAPGGPGTYGESAAADYAAGYGRPGHGSGQYDQGGFDGRFFPEADRGTDERGAGQGYDASGGTADYPRADYGSAGHGDSGYGHAGYGDASHSSAGYADTSHSADSYSSDRPRGGDYDAARYQPADYGAGRPDGQEPTAYEYHPAGYERGYAEDDPARRGGYPGDDYATGSYRAGSADYLTGEHPVTGYRDGTRADSSPDYLSGGYGSQSTFPPGGRQRDDSRFSPDTGGQPSAETDGFGYQEERFVPPYVAGGGESYLNDNRPRTAGYDGDLDAAGYPADGPPVSSPEPYHEAQWPGEAYSYGSEYRRR